MEVRGQLHALAVLLLTKKLSLPFEEDDGWFLVPVWTFWRRGNRTLNHPALGH
jgi:hypothetical protein